MPVAIVLRPVAAPLRARGANLTALTLQDISSQKRSQVLEETFYREVLNEIDGLARWSELLLGADNATAARALRSLTDNLREAVGGHQTLLAAEREEFVADDRGIDVAESWA